MEKLFFIQFNVSKVAAYSYLLDDTDNDHPSISFYSSMCSVAQGLLCELLLSLSACSRNVCFLFRSQSFGASIDFLSASFFFFNRQQLCRFLFCPRFLPNKLLRKSLFQEKKNSFLWGGLFCFVFVFVQLSVFFFLLFPEAHVVWSKRKQCFLKLREEASAERRRLQGFHVSAADNCHYWT